MSVRIEELCAALSLSAIGRDYANLADEAARKKLSFTDYLERVLEAEHGLRQQRSRQMLVKLATFPSVKTLDEFDFKVAAGVPKAR
ncbi:MAG: ATP-binding protein, partial [Pseudomonadales bacterium]|nr:ATP-binding protein [Pseudomonadales bacterium]